MSLGTFLTFPTFPLPHLLLDPDPCHSIPLHTHTHLLHFTHTPVWTFGSLFIVGLQYIYYTHCCPHTGLRTVDSAPAYLTPPDLLDIVIPHTFVTCWCHT